MNKAKEFHPFISLMSQLLAIVVLQLLLYLFSAIEKLLNVNDGPINIFPHRRSGLTLGN